MSLMTSSPLLVCSTWRRGKEVRRVLLQEHAVLTTTPSQLQNCCYHNLSEGPGQRVKPGTPEAEGQVGGLGEKGEKYVLRFP